MSTRRKLLVVLGLTPLSAALLSLAQQPAKVRRIGFLATGSRSTSSNPNVYYDALVRGMRELGYVEGKNLAIEWRFAEGNYERLPDMAVELAGMKVEVIVVDSTPAARAAQRATRTIPIVAAILADPVGSGFAASLGRPGGNITGLSIITVDLAPKLLELLKTMLPKLSRAAILTHPDATHHPAIVKNTQAAALQFGIEISPVSARSVEDIERGFTTLTRERAVAVIVAGTPLFTGQMRQIAALALQHRLASTYTVSPAYARAGGLMSYGADNIEYFHRAAGFVDKILKGAKPGDLPIEQPTKIHLAINRKTAKALGLKIPQELLLRADEVIE